MTRRAVIIGFTCRTLIAGFGYLNDWVFRLNHIAGNHFPISVFGGLVLFSLGLNPLLRRVFPRAALKRSELAVVMALTLVGCTIPGSGLMREFTQILALPAHFERTTPGWQRAEACTCLETGTPWNQMKSANFSKRILSRVLKQSRETFFPKNLRRRLSIKW